MGFMDDIDRQLQNLGKKIDNEDPAYVRTDCPKCGEKDIRIHKMRARHGHTRCPKCGTDFVVKMVRQ